MILKLRNYKWLDVSFAPLLISAIITISVIYLIFLQTQGILADRLKERLIAIASTAALQFDANELNKIQGPDALDSEILKKNIDKMKAIRDSNQNLRYIYIWRKTDDPYIVQFVLDAEMLNPIDENANGIIEDTELPPLPGEDYDITDTPEVIEAFNAPTTTVEFISDKWGTFSSGFAPIKDENNNTVAIIGIDVEVGDFYRLVSAMFTPFVLLALLLLSVLSIQTLLLIRIWKSRVEIVQELDRQKDELLGIVSHQLATPVASFKWYTEMLIDGDLGKITKDQKNHLSSMKAVAANLSDLVSMILDVSRIQLGKMNIEKQELDLNTFFKEIIEIIEPKAKEKKIQFNIAIPKHLPKARLDKRYTHMTIVNLLSNAMKYTPNEGEVKLDVKIKNKKLYCEVTDTGCGIPSKDQDKIFGKLFRASNVRNTVDGNGFGLFVAKGAIEAQSGSIRFKSVEGKGTTFLIELPI